MPNRRIHLAPPSVGALEMESVKAALESGWVAPVGPELNGFESDISAYTGIKAAVALSSGTAALHLGLLAVGIKPDDEVVCPTLTFAATAFAIVHAGATPVFLDSEETSWNLDPHLLNEFLTARAARGQLPRAVIAVDLFGRTSDYDALSEITARFELPLICDAAESLGSTHGDRSAGTFGKLGVFSFNGNKIITSSGGGMLVSDDADIVDKVRYWSTQSREDLPWYEHKEIGFNYRMSNIVAALGRAQLARLPEIIDARRRVSSWYQEELGSLDGVRVSGDPPWGKSNHWLTTVTLDSIALPNAPTRIREALAAQDIECRPIWKPMHQQPVFVGRESHLTGAADRLFAEGLCLPSGFDLTRTDVARVCRTILDTLGP